VIMIMGSDREKVDIDAALERLKDMGVQWTMVTLAASGIYEGAAVDMSFSIKPEEING